MPVIKREITQNIASSIVQSGQFLHVIIGPRQAGKSTAAKQIAQDLDLPTHSVSADGPEIRTVMWLEEQWRIALTLGSDERPALLPLYPSHSSRASKPKIIVQNNALITAITDRSFDETAQNRDRIGRLAENAVGAHLLNTLHLKSTIDRKSAKFFWLCG